MKNLLVPRSDIGYFFLLIDMAMTPDDPDQMEMEFGESKAADESEKYFTNSLMLEDYL
jgi:hypothetical protein